MRLSPGIGAVAATVAALGGVALANAPAPERGAADPPELAVGVVPQRPLEPGEGLAMRRAGIGWTRVWLSWAGAEQTKGKYDWGRSDELIGAASGEGLSVLPMLFGSPQWAAQRDRHPCWGHGCIPFAPASSETRDAFAQFAGAAARRYGPSGAFWAQHPAVPYRPIRVWQVWNEQNMNAFFRPRADAEAYAALVAPAAEQIHDQDPEAQVLLGGMFGPRNRRGLVATTRFLADLYGEPQVAGSFDAVAIHPYSGSALGALQQVRRVRRTIHRHGSGESIWVTEIGWASGGRRGLDLVKDRRRQARLLRRMFSRFVSKHESWDLGGAFWYAWRDTERGMAVCGWCARAGLISRSGRPKPAYRMLRRVLSPR